LVLRQMTQIGDDAARTAVFPVPRRAGCADRLAVGRPKRLSGRRILLENGPPRAALAGEPGCNGLRRATGQGRNGLAGANLASLTMAEMTRPGSPGGPAGPRAAKRRKRTERLAAALRDNLRRRKAQARDRAAEAGQPGPNPGQDHGLRQEPAEGCVNKKFTDKADPGQGS
jgi:hypothetical protein